MGMFDSRVALITGGAGGIGAATARLFAERGAVVISADLHEPRIATDATELPGTYMTLDVTSEESWALVVDQIVHQYGRLDVLVNAAGIVGDVVLGTLENTTLEEWRKVMAVNLDGTFLGCRTAMKAMANIGEGVIINLSSVGSYYPTTQSVAYGASKGGVTQLTKSVALFGSQDGLRIRCNSVHPGRTDTAMLDTIISQRAQRSKRSDASSAQRIPLGPAGTPQDVAHLIAFLASDEARYITGSEFVVDGGWKLLR